MNPTEQLKALLTETYIDEDGDEYKIELMPGLTDAEITHLESILPQQKIPIEVRELLHLTKGFDFYGFDTITFNGYGQFGLEEIFPNIVEIAHDGAGNFWIIDINSKGDWGNVFYACHDPAVIVKHSVDLSEFLQHIDEYGKKPRRSHLGRIYDQVVYDIWNKLPSFTEIHDAIEVDDEILKNFALSLPNNYLIIDLRNAPTGSGFPIDKHGITSDNAIRCGDLLLWGLQKTSKKSFIATLLNLFKG